MRMPHAARHATHAARRRDGERGGGVDGRRGWRANVGDAHGPGSGCAGDGWAAERVGAADLSKQGLPSAQRSGRARPIVGEWARGQLARATREAALLAAVAADCMRSEGTRGRHEHAKGD